ncbi:type II toxin-antitoxin system RelE/ParE family toxin [Ekhidna sp.]|uniref:type II toxin-antitoxin system RelE/ParE family toxin n=1 Tax=Ekhidna sp. TaxID=2608089 RepID=UPI0035190446
MVREIIWTQKAHLQKLEIFRYWNEQNASDSFSRSLDDAINKAIDLLSKFPKLGIKTQVKNVRVKVVKNYLLIYRIDEEILYILLFWDSRQNPNDLNRLLNLYQ